MRRAAVLRFAVVRRARVVVAGGVFAGAALLGPASPGTAIPLLSVPPALNDARAAIAALTSYTATVAVHETVGSRELVRTVTIAVKRPATKMTIVDGTKPGTVIAWRGDGKTRLRRLGILAHLPAVAVDRASPALAFADGAPVTSVLFPDAIAAFDPSIGTIAQSAGPVIAGAATDDITEELPATPPAKARRIVLTLDRATHLPVRFARYVEDTLVETAVYENVVPNAQLRDADVTV
jgi:hypothetical protein